MVHSYHINGAYYVDLSFLIGFGLTYVSDCSVYRTSVCLLYGCAVLFGLLRHLL